MRRFKILKTGNFYFPIKDKEKKFIVESTLDLKIDRKYNSKIGFCLKNNKILYLRELAEPIWNACKKESKNYKDAWFVPISLSKIGKDYLCMVDILKMVK